MVLEVDRHMDAIWIRFCCCHRNQKYRNSGENVGMSDHFLFSLIIFSIDLFNIFYTSWLIKYYCSLCINEHAVVTVLREKQSFVDSFSGFLIFSLNYPNFRTQFTILSQLSKIARDTGCKAWFFSNLPSLWLIRNFYPLYYIFLELIIII